MASLKFACGVVVICMVVVSALMTEAITCGEVIIPLASCIAYIQSGGTPSKECCNGVNSVKNAAKTTSDRQAVCNCLKSSATRFPGNNAAELPGKCGVNIPYKISPSTDCSKITF